MKYFASSPSCRVEDVNDGEKSLVTIMKTVKRIEST